VRDERFDCMNIWDWGAFFEYLRSPYLMGGAWVTIWLTVASMAIGLVLGMTAALMKMSKSPVVRAPAAFYVWLWRGTPLLVQLIIIYTGLPALGIKLSVIQSALLGIGVNEGAYLSEIIRAGILSVNSGQFEAARALAMDYPTMMRVVIFPQAARVILPPLGNSLNGLLKTSSLASVISMEELLRRAQLLIQVRFAVLEIFFVTAIYYVVMTSVWSLVQRRIEAHFSQAFAGQDMRAARPQGRLGRKGPGGRDIEGNLLEQDAR
jgi:polar amino acid transport system permease protein